MSDVFQKGHVKGHLRGTSWVRDHERVDGGKSPSAPAQPSLWGKFHKDDHGMLGIMHPAVDDEGKPVKIDRPSVPSSPEAWLDPESSATVVPGGHVPDELNGVAFAPWEDAPTTPEGWAAVPGQKPGLDQTDLHIPKGKRGGTGVVVVEPDGRLWLVAPTNGFGGYHNTFPKGTLEPELSLQANAIKECYEESGLQVEITDVLGDFERTTSVARYYLAHRVGGTPADMGWESQAVRLASPEDLHVLLNSHTDWPILDAAGFSLD